MASIPKWLKVGGDAGEKKRVVKTASIAKQAAGKLDVQIVLSNGKVLVNIDGAMPGNAAYDAVIDSLLTLPWAQGADLFDVKTRMPIAEKGKRVDIGRGAGIPMAQVENTEQQNTTGPVGQGVTNVVAPQQTRETLDQNA